MLGHPTPCDRERNAASIANHPLDDPTSPTPAGRLLASCQTASMVNRVDGDQFHFDPATYIETICGEVPAYDELQDAVAEATAAIHAERVLELGVGTGQTSRRLLDLHPEAELVGIDESTEMLAAVSADLAADLRVSRLGGPTARGKAPGSIRVGDTPFSPEDGTFATETREYLGTNWARHPVIHYRRA